MHTITQILLMHLSLILKHLNLLLVDDNHRTHAELYSLFAPMFKTITMAQDAETALQHFEDRPLDLIITDIRMPGIDGLAFIERIRTINREIPILILSAHTDQDLLFRAANLQIDGYITKPLSFNKLEPALTRAVARLEHRVGPMHITDAITYHPLLKSLHVDDREVSLGSKECTLLELFLYNHHKVISKQDIHEAVWPDEIVSESALKNLLSELRGKLHYDVIRNRHGLGWTLTTEK